MNEQPTANSQQPTGIAFVAVLVLAFFLCIAGLGKLLVVVRGDDSALNPLVAAFIGFLELILAWALVWNTPHGRCIAWRASSVMGLMFFGNMILRRTLWGGDSSCGCMGYFESKYLPDWMMILLYACLIACSSPIGVLTPLAVSDTGFGKFLVKNTSMSFLLGVAFAFSSNVQARDSIVNIFVPQHVRFVTEQGLPTKRFDLGEVRNDSTFRFRASLQNSGRRSVRIIGSKQSCRCARVVSCPQVLEPGETVTAEIEYSSPKTDGDHTVTFTMYLDEANQQQVSAVAHLKVASDHQESP